MEEVAAQLIFYMKKIVNCYVKFFKQFCQLRSTIEQGAFPSTSELWSIARRTFSMFSGVFTLFPLSLLVVDTLSAFWNLWYKSKIELRKEEVLPRQEYWTFVENFVVRL